MRKDLTIGEVAKLLDTSTYNLRYYQKQGIISPSGRSENGYRLFNLDDVIHIKCVMLFRESGIAIKEIRKLLNNYNKDNYTEALKRSLDRIISEIKRLVLLKADIEKTLCSAQNIVNRFSIRSLDARIFSEIKRSGYNESYSAKELFDIGEKEGINKSLILSNDLYYVLYDDEISLCVPAQSNRDCVSISYNKGKYLCYEFMINDYEDTKKIDDRINEFIEYITNNQYKHKGELLFIVHLGTSLITETGFCGELQIRIE